MNKEFMIKATEGVKSEHVRSGCMKIPVIKALRRATGQGLREAKENVEELFRGGVVVIRTTDDQYEDRKRSLYTAIGTIRSYPNYFIIDEDFHPFIGEIKIGERSINITAKERDMIISALEGRKSMLELLTPGDFPGEEPKDWTALVCKIIAQTKEK